MVAYVLDENLQHVRTIRMWRGEFGTAPPFDIGPDTLFVAYTAWAEMTCFMTLGWQFPGAHLRSAHRLSRGQQHPAAVQSGRGAQAPAQALVRCLPRLRDRRLGTASTRKRSPSDIGEGRWRDYGQEAVFDYCEEDVRDLGAAAARTTARPSPDCRRPTSSTCCTGRTTAPRRSRRSRRAACRSTCRCGIWCRRTRPRSSASCCGNSIRATAATIRSTRRTASGATRASSAGWSAPACRHGRAWRAASSTSTATPSA